jgi:hypothetical protein
MSKQLLQESDVEKWVARKLPEFGDAKTVQDRKYLLYEIFRYADYNNSLGFKCEKYQGSNQVRLYIDGEYVYDSDEDDLVEPSVFLANLYSWLKLYIQRRDKAQ